ncbi:sigma 54-interacting transcriptional regulator [Fusibacter paucivorans]|uniref:Sigma 54-interacting transcriptional regulator n=1 Tax=Fusibacter paucivorans TaxID=76009 RepID=A0ABS5PSP9_9FIRM|nr:sigma 54-interacting transcriptional regulator [Fusibacter paucivorans]MBS7527937.1 sigma 54-interacting transcriptional regulator [Fusibacter paucivorans]
MNRFEQESQSVFGNYTETQLVNNDTERSIVYGSVVMKNLISSLKRLTNADVPILIYGETGTGKEVLAQYIHSSSKRKEHSMICINCAAIAPSLFEAEMFGYSKGAFTGSNPSGKKGLFESADGSTLFLDEVDSLPLEQQGKLLRALETKTIVRLGESKPIKVDFRLLVATNKNLHELVAMGKFREDLYYRLNVVPAYLPPLREREGDIRILSDYFLSHYLQKYDIKKKFSEDIYQQLESYSWPGNIRELKNLIERIVLMTDPSEYEIETITLPSGEMTSDFYGENNKCPVKKLIRNTPLVTEAPLEDQLSAYEKEILIAALKKYRNSSDAANALGISCPTMSRKMAKYRLSKQR